MIENAYKYSSDYAIHPGEFLDELLISQEVQQKELAERTGVSEKHISNIVNGKANISPEFAHKLELVLGTPASYWLALSNQYLSDIIRLKGLEEKQQEWLEKWPYNLMVKMGWVPSARDKKEKYLNILRFFRCASMEDTERYYETPLAVYFRQKTTKANKENVIVWLCKGEHDTNKMNLRDFSKEIFERNLIEIRKLVKNPPEQFEKRLIELCGQAGVAMVFTKELPNTGICGATRKIKNGKTMLIQMSLRYKTHDHLWFTFFHEACHALKHEGMFIDFRDQKINAFEEEADRFSSDYLIPPEDYNSFISAKVFTARSIKAFACKMDLHPGIVVGRLQHDKHIPYKTSLNSLKMPLRWAA